MCHALLVTGDYLRKCADNKKRLTQTTSAWLSVASIAAYGGNALPDLGHRYLRRLLRGAVASAAVPANALVGARLLNIVPHLR